MNTDKQHQSIREMAIDDAGELEDFIYVLSHDVRGSVRALLELPQWIKEDLIEEGHEIKGSLAESFDLMQTHMGRLDRMLIDLLEYSRVGRKQSVQTVDLAAAIALVMEQLSVPPAFKVTLDLQCKSLRIGEKDILVLLKALLSNAIKHHDKAEGQITLSTTRDGFDCTLCVRDDGPGIAEKHRKQVFDTMKTLQPRDEIEGSGMGLATVSKIVNFYDGRLCWVDGLNGRGIGLEARFPV
ncbi:MAG: ATP-binding protein [Roseovarius sp.]